MIKYPISNIHIDFNQIKSNISIITKSKIKRLTYDFVYGYAIKLICLNKDIICHVYWSSLFNGITLEIFECNECIGKIGIEHFMRYKYEQRN